jgi:hypothetical protein
MALQHLNMGPTAAAQRRGEAAIVCSRDGDGRRTQANVDEKEDKKSRIFYIYA